MPEGDVDEDRLEGPLSSLFQQITSQPRWLQNASIGPNESRQRCDVADKEKRHEVRLIDDLIQPKGFRPFEIWPFKAVDHFDDDCAGQVARRGQFQPLAFGRSPEQNQRVAGDGGLGDFDAGQVVCKS